MSEPDPGPTARPPGPRLPGYRHWRPGGGLVRDTSAALCAEFTRAEAACFGRWCDLFDGRAKPPTRPLPSPPRRPCTKRLAGCGTGAWLTRRWPKPNAGI